MTNNYEIIKPLLDFSDPDKFYIVHIVSRRKDGHESQEVSERNIKTYLIPSEKYFDTYISEMESLCKVFNARAWLYINQRSFSATKRAMTKCLNEETNYKIDGPSSLYGLFGWCAKFSGTGVSPKWWIIDVDPYPDKIVTDQDLSDSLDDLRDRITAAGGCDFTVVPSKTGCHLITRPFSTDKWEEIWATGAGYCVSFTLKKDTFTNLIVP